MSDPPAYVVDWLITPDDYSLPERRGVLRISAESMVVASQDTVAWAETWQDFDYTRETITLRARRAGARGELPQLPSPRDSGSSPPSSP